MLEQQTVAQCKRVNGESDFVSKDTGREKNVICCEQFSSSLFSCARDDKPAPIFIVTIVTVFAFKKQKEPGSYAQSNALIL